MKKAWLYQRKNIKGWWVGWYESGKRKAKLLPNKNLAEHFKNIKYQQINSDVYTSIVNIGWNQLKTEYLFSKQVSGLTKSSITEVESSLNRLYDLTGILYSRQITQITLDKFVYDLQSQTCKNKKKPTKLSRFTINKEISNITALLTWSAAQRYVPAGLRLSKLSTDDAPVKFLNTEQIRELILQSSKFFGWDIRVLLALTTGLRREDIENLTITDMHFDRNTISTKSKKTGKAMGERPVPEPVMNRLTKHLEQLPEKHQKLFVDTFTSKKWSKIRKLAGLENFKFHDLRKTFSSTLAQRGVSTAVCQRLLEHSTPELTNKVYTNVDPVLKEAIDKIPVTDWL